MSSRSPLPESDVLTLKHVSALVAAGPDAIVADYVVVQLKYWEDFWESERKRIEEVKRKREESWRIYCEAKAEGEEREKCRWGVCKWRSCKPDMVHCNAGGKKEEEEKGKEGSERGGAGGKENKEVDLDGGDEDGHSDDEDYIDEPGPSHYKTALMTDTGNSYSTKYYIPCKIAALVQAGMRRKGWGGSDEMRRKRWGEGWAGL